MFRGLLALAITPTFCALAGPDLQKEDIRSVQQAFRKSDASLDWFWVTEKKSLDPTRSVMIVEAAPTEERPAGLQRVPKRLPIPGKTQTGVFVVAGASNRVTLILDVFPVNEMQGSPSIGQPGLESLNLHFSSDYGLYGGSIKYFFDLGSGKPPRKFRYGMLALTSSTPGNGRLVYSGSSFGRGSRVEIEPRPGSALPAYKITDVPAAEPEPVPETASLRLPDGSLVVVSNTPPGQPHRTAGFSLIRKSGVREFYPAPVPTAAMHRKLRPGEQAPGEIENNVGPVAQQGSTIWFANSFYDGEGVSGVGAIGSFDALTHKFDMRYLPEIAPWSGSAMRLDGDDLWIGLMRQPEGSAYSAGLLRYNTKTEAIMKYDIPDYVYTIDRLGDTIYCGTSNGLYTLRGEEITQMRFEPDPGGRIAMVTTPK